MIFLDESGLKTNMTRLYGRALGGRRCLDSVPCGQWETLTILSSARLNGTTESLVFEGAVDRKMFDAYIKEILAPTCTMAILLSWTISARISLKKPAKQSASARQQYYFSPPIVQISIRLRRWEAKSNKYLSLIHI